MKPAAKHLLTKSGLWLHPIGIGTWGLGEFSTFSPGAETEIKAIQYALSLGQNHIDTAEMYAKGGAEQIVGRAIKSSNREDIFIASKLWKNHVAEGTVRLAVEAMLERLDTNYIDMLYIHAPWFDEPWQEAISQIDDLINEGVVRYFGVSNFSLEKIQIATVLSKHGIAASQIHYSCLHQSEATPELKDYCTANNIQLIAYMPLEKGDVNDNTAIQSIAANHRVTAAQVALAWLLQKGAYPIPKATSRKHIDQNHMATNITLQDFEMKALETQS